MIVDTPRNEAKQRRGWLRRCEVSDVPDLIGPKAPPSKENAANLQGRLAEREVDFARRSSFLGGVTKEQAERLLRHGWPEGAGLALRLASELRGSVTPPTNVRRRPIWSDQGDELDRDRLLSGNLDQAWRRTVRAATFGPRTLTLVLPWTHAAQIHANDLCWGAVAGIAVCDLLEDAGYSVELLALNAVAPHSSPNVCAGTVVTVKAPSDPLRPDAVAGMFAHAATHRYWGILAKAGAPWSLGDGWGYPLRATEAVGRLHRAGLLDAPELVADQCYGAQAARAMVEQLLATVEQRTAAA